MIAVRETGLFTRMAPNTIEDRWPGFLGVERIRLSCINLRVVRELLSDFGEEAVCQHFLVAEEKEYFSRFSLPKRKVEWLGGRIAAKHATSGFGLRSPRHECAIEWHCWKILADARGKPVLRFAGQNSHDKEGGEVSISHSGEFATAVVSWGGPCGVDLQVATERVMRVRRWFCRDQELSVFSEAKVLSGMDETDRLTLLWVVKEAARKVCEVDPLAGFLELHAQALVPAQGVGVAVAVVFQRGAMHVPFIACCLKTGSYHLAVASKRRGP